METPQTDKQRNAQNVSMGKLDPYKDVEFEQFLKLIGEDGLHSWSLIADILKVDPATVSRWKNHPRAKEALTNAIKETMENMTAAGKGDWKMYESKIKMLGWVPKTQQDLSADIQSGGAPLNILFDLKGANDAGESTA